MIKMSRRVRIKSLAGGLTTERKSKLRYTLFEHGVKFSRLIEDNEAYIVVCHSDDDVDLSISTEIINKLKKDNFEVVVPPPLRARKSIIIRRLDHEITAFGNDEIKAEIEDKNIWAKVDEVVKMKNIAHMMKVRFRDIAMARKAIGSGLCLFGYHLSTSQIEQEEFYSITPCWRCYKYDHNFRDCTVTEVRCSECAESGHMFRDCKNRSQPKCLNCGGQHRTLAAACPIRKDIIKKKREESNKKKGQEVDKTYAAVTKLHQAIPQMVERKTKSVINLNKAKSFQVLVITIHAHLANMARPGSFGKTVRELLKLNNLPDVILPDDAPSFEIFGAINGLQPLDIPEVRTQHGGHGREDSDADVETETDVDVLDDGFEASGVSRMDMSSRLDITSQFDQSSQMITIEEREKEPVKLAICFITSEDDNIPDSLAPPDLIKAIDRGRVKYICRGTYVSGDILLKFIKDGEINTLKNLIKKVDKSTFKKVRNGFQERGSGEKRRKRTYKK